MFNNRKYVFETRHTKTIRKLKGLLFSVISFMLIYSITCLILLLVSKRENQIAKETFFKRSPDLIVVFTGDTGRIPLAIKLAKEMKQTNILISGVHSKNNVDLLLKDINTEAQINPNYLELDYRAKNTYENVVRTLEYLRKSKGLKDILVVSHDYHILRIKALFGERKRKKDDYNFYYIGVNSDLSRYRNVKILYKEVYKFLRTIAYISLADID